jgi:hypothetical protein
LSVDDARRFRLALDGEDIVAGAVESQGPTEARVVTLVPSSPDWALPRRINVHCTRNGDMLTARTTIGGATASVAGDQA